MKKIDGVQPISGFRLDCYRNALLPAVRFFNKDIRPFLLAKIGKYQYDKTLDFVEIELMRYNMAFKYIGIGNRYFNTSSETIKKDICDFVDKKVLVIVYLDTYYYPHFPASYNKFHSRHGVLVHGYDWEKNVFYLVDTDFIESFEYKNIVIPMENVVYAHEKMVEHFKMRNYVETIENFSENRKSFFEDYVRFYTNYFISNYDCFVESINKLQYFVECFGLDLNCEETAMKYVPQLFISLNRVINCRHLMYYSYSCVFKGVEDILHHLEILLDDYNYVRSVMYKSYYSKQYRSVSFEKCYEIMKRIVIQEKELHHNILEYFQKYVVIV